MLDDCHHTRKNTFERFCHLGSLGRESYSFGNLSYSITQKVSYQFYSPSF